MPSRPCPSLRLLWMGALLVCAACRSVPGTPAPAQAPRAATAPDPVAPAVEEIVARQRQILVLMDGADALDEATRTRATVVGRLLFAQNHEALEGLTAALESGLDNPAATGNVARFLDLLERDAALRDADKLVFRGLLEELAEGLRARRPGPEGQALLSRLEEDRRGLEEIRARYEQELERIFGQLETRALTVRRERWDAYLAYVKTLYAREALLASHAAELAALDEGLRGGPAKPAPKKRDPLLIDGLSLPPMTVVLTFDDGPHPKHTPAVLDVLDTYKVKSIFFEVGQSVGKLKPDDTVAEGKGAESTRRILHDGHLLANHTYSHQFLPKLTDAKLSHEIDDSKKIIEAASRSKITLFRPPYGARNATVDTALASRKLKAFLWNVDSLDWSDPVPKSIADRVVRQVEAQKRGVILLHDIHKQSVEALPLILETLQKRGYKFVLWDGETVLGGDQAVASRGGEVTATPRPGKALYRESHAVVVGINDYAKWPKLSYAVNDAKAVRDMLVSKFLFKPQNVHLLLDGEATREKILAVLGDALADPGKVDKEDRVFVFFAGHGVTRKLPNGRSLGYIVPVDADTKNYAAEAISMTNFQDVSESIPAKHVFFVMDACYSGLALTRGGAGGPGGDTRKYLEEVTRRTTREVLTAGGADEQVADRGPNGHSIFTWTLLQGLEGRADSNGDGYLTATELASYVGPAVSALSRQTPAFGSLVGSEGGEFVLELNHEGEFLSDVSAQLDQEAVEVNGELERIRKLIAEKEARNKALKGQLAQAQAQLAGLEPGRGGPSADTVSANATAGGVANGTATGTPNGSDEEARRENDRGMRLYREKKYEPALAAFQHATQLDPNNEQATNNLGFVLYKLNRVGEALPWLEKTIALAPQRAPAYVNLGDAYDALGKKAEAASAYERYLQLMPGSPLAERVKKRLGELKP